ncbi:diacylglycerol kinase family protein [Mesorhizobium sp. WSM2239]|uniref:Diacylglycerol kinase family protein n=2 Tax=unclassified Mesorhizobium TaxID=325217 RepID=A0AAU8DCU9_9HYPH
MRFLAVLNRDGGALRGMDLKAFSAKIKETLEAAGHLAETRIVAGDEIVDALAEAAQQRPVDVVLAGGGDGTISAAAAALKDRNKALAILPAGTMNLFARSLGVPQSLDEALASFANGEIKPVDVASANGRVFVHQFSIGMHAKMVRLRDKMEFRSRLGKIGASVKAAYTTVMNPPTMTVSLEIGDAEIVTRTTGIGVTNNLFGEGHLPYADHPDGGVLGVYVTVARQRGELLRFMLSVARGKWRDNQQVEIHEAERVVLKIRAAKAGLRCVIDGELSELERETVLEIHPKSLRVLVPKSSGQTAWANSTG